MHRRLSVKDKSSSAASRTYNCIGKRTSWTAMCCLDHERPRKPTMRNASHTIREELVTSSSSSALSGGCSSSAGSFLDWTDYGVVPRTLGGLAGIPAMPFLHKDLHPHSEQHVPAVHPLGPSGWLQGPTVGGRCRNCPAGRSFAVAFWTAQIHIGASGLIFGLIAFLIVSGFLERRLVSFAIAVLVGFIYGELLFPASCRGLSPTSPGRGISGCRGRWNRGLCSDPLRTAFINPTAARSRGFGTGCLLGLFRFSVQSGGQPRWSRGFSRKFRLKARSTRHFVTFATNIGIFQQGGGCNVNIWPSETAFQRIDLRLDGQGCKFCESALEMCGHRRQCRDD